MPIREQEFGCSAKGEPGAERKSSIPWYPSKRSRASLGIVTGYRMALNARQVHGDILKLRPSWEGRWADQGWGQVDTGPSTASLQCTVGKDCVLCLSLNSAPRPGEGCLTRVFSTFSHSSGPKVTSTLYQNYPWAPAAKALQEEKYRVYWDVQELEAEQKQVRDGWKAKNAEKSSDSDTVFVGFFSAFAWKISRLCWSTQSVVYK